MPRHLPHPPTDYGTDCREHNEMLINLAMPHAGFVKFVFGFMLESLHWKLATAARFYLEIEDPKALASFDEKHGKTPHQLRRIIK